MLRVGTRVGKEMDTNNSISELQLVTKKDGKISEKRQILQNYAKKFSEETTLHGMKNYCSYNFGIVKLLWLSVICGMAIGYIVTVTESFKAFLQ